MDKVEKLISIAEEYIGTKEVPANSNTVIFNTEYYNRKVSGANYPWCVTFLWYVFNKADLSKYFYNGGKTASCTQLATAYPSRLVYENYKRGDLIFFNFSGGTTKQHVGVCTGVSDGFITTIDGNTGTSNEANGGAVMARTRGIKYVVCGIRWYEEVKKKIEVKLTAELLKSGSNGDYVEALQLLLNGFNCYCGIADGVFGSKTLAAVKKFQGLKNLVVDGEVGENTWNALLKG